MEALLLASILSCSDAQWIINGVNDVDMPQTDKSQVIIQVLQAMPDDCVIDRNGSRSSQRKRQLKGTGLINPTPFRRKPMKVTYRGVSYDTAEYRNRPTQTKEVQETYRGIQYTTKVNVEAAK